MNFQNCKYIWIYSFPSEFIIIIFENSEKTIFEILEANNFPFIEYLIKRLIDWMTLN